MDYLTTHTNNCRCGTERYDTLCELVQALVEEAEAERAKVERQAEEIARMTRERDAEGRVGRNCTQLLADAEAALEAERAKVADLEKALKAAKAIYAGAVKAFHQEQSRSAEQRRKVRELREWHRRQILHWPELITGEDFMHQQTRGKMDALGLTGEEPT